ncbi:NADH pyrophosphatase [Escherichia coli]|nr:NADH pyrophosphatase [Escherichia coli]
MGDAVQPLPLSVTTRKSPPALLFAIRRDDSILLAQHTRHRNGGPYSTCRIRRSGRNPRAGSRAGSDGRERIKVKNLRYVTSQPWPFPQSLMTAFMAEYDSGDIVIDPKELLEANWYRYDDLPLLPARPAP